MGRKRRRQVAWDEQGIESEVIGGISDEDYVSRTHKRHQKRQLIETRLALLEQCIQLEDEAWIGFDVGGDIRTQLQRLKTMKSSGARQRLLKHVQAQTNDSMWDTLQQVCIQADEAQKRLEKQASKRQAWCDRLILEGEEALGPAQTRFPQAEIHILRKLIFQIQRAPQSKQAQGARKLLLNYLEQWDQTP